MADIRSIRWQESGFEYAVIGDAPMNELISFIESITTGPVEIPPENEETPEKPQIEVPVDLKVEKNEQKKRGCGTFTVETGSCLCRTSIVSLKISPEGIEGEYPVSYEDMEVVKNNGIEAVVEISGDNTPVRRVY